jgi:adenylosuccinate lyase
MIDRYTRPPLAEIWSETRRYETWLAVELAACEAMEAAGTVAPGTAAAVRAAAAGKLDPARILEIEGRTRHDVIAFLAHVEELAGEPARWLHLGMTSSDVLDASFAILLREAADQILEGTELLMAACARRAEEQRETAMIGRSHGIHAEPITAGLVFAGFASEVARARRALLAAREEISVGKIAGAVGTYASLDPRIELQALARLGLAPELVPTQIVARDRHAGYFAALARLGTAIERIALTVRHWQRTEVGEATEAFGAGQKGSSAMPHKKNPILSENLCGLARLLRAYAGAALENVALWHERDISHSSVERVIGPDATATADFMVRRAAALVDGLVIDAGRMQRNLGQTGGLVFSEGVMLALVRKGLGRQAAYELVQEHALAALPGGGPSFRERLTTDTRINVLLSPPEIDQVFDLRHHLRWSGAIIDRALRDLPPRRGHP